MSVVVVLVEKIWNMFCYQAAVSNAARSESDGSHILGGGWCSTWWSSSAQQARRS